MSIEKRVNDIADFMAIAARTAPKAKGEDNIIIKTFQKSDLNNFADKMIEAGADTSRLNVFERDAKCIRKSLALIIIGTTYNTLKLDCGFCGVPNCLEAEEKNITCAYNSGDLGIAVGSAVTIASKFHVDNRIMFTAGYTAKKYGILEVEVRMALGIPLSVSGKSPYFDR